MTTVLEDLKKANPNTFKRLAYIYYKSGQQIGELPILGVDEDLQKFGFSVAGALRGLSDLASGTSSQNKFLQANMGGGYGYAPYNYSGYGYGYGGGYGYNYTVPGVGYYSNVSNMASLIYQGSMEEGAVRRGTWRNIDNATMEIRKKMTDKFQIEFR